MLPELKLRLVRIFGLKIFKKENMDFTLLVSCEVKDLEADSQEISGIFYAAYLFRSQCLLFLSSNVFRGQCGGLFLL